MSAPSETSPTRKKWLAELELIRRRALSDLYYFDKYVLGYDKMVERVHGPFCKFLQREVPHEQGEQVTKLILMPRGSFKSVCGTVGYTLWRLARDPNLTVLITNEKLDKSKGFLKNIKGHITDNPRFKALFGEWSCENKAGKKWSETRIDIAPRTKMDAAPSIEVSSVESSEVGKHVDLLIPDDLVGASNITTPEQMDKVIDYYRDLGAVLKPGGEMVPIGTRWDFRDLYQYILDIKKRLGDFARIEVMIAKAVNDDGSYLFPEELSPQFLALQRAKMGTYVFNCQYMNNPVGKDNALIQEESILKWNYQTGEEGESGRRTKTHVLYLNKEELDAYPHYVTIDLAHTDNKRSDSTAIVVNSVNPNSGTWYVRHYDTFKATDPNEIINRIFAINKEYPNILTWGIEKNNYGTWLQKPLEDAMRRNGVWLNIEALGHYGNQGNKALRLRSLAPRFGFRNCYIREDMVELEDQLLTLTYDGAKGHDDLLDAFAMQEEVANWGNQEEANRPDNEEELADKKDTFKDDEIRRYRSLIESEEESADAWMYV